MNEKYLVINSGSSSLKFSLYSMPDATEIVNGYIEKIGKVESFYTLRYSGKKIEKHFPIYSHKDAVEVMIKELIQNNFVVDMNEIKGVGHRIVHGGEFYSKSVLIDEEVLKNIRNLTKFATLHHPGEIAGVESIQEKLPNVPQIAVFDTAFHQTMPKENYMYAIPYEWYEENGVRKYGFHGTSHKYITETMQRQLGKEDVNLIICHIGSGASMCCVKNGKCFDTTMGLTPLDGLVMGTRCGTIDSSIIEYICKERKMSVEDVNAILNNQSGLLGLAGKNDFRDLEKLANSGDEKAKLAIKMLQNSITKFIAQYFVELNGIIDAIVFTAGIGENGISLRANVVNSLSNVLNIKLDEDSNNSIAKFKEKQSGIISTPDSKINVFVIPTNEEYMILKDTYEISQFVKENTQVKVLTK